MSDKIIFTFPEAIDDNKEVVKIESRGYKKAIKKGYNLVPPEIAIYSRLIYTKQKTGEWIRFATPFYSMVDSDKVPHLPKLGKALGCYFLETYWSYPKAIFHPKNQFIFKLKWNH